MTCLNCAVPLRITELRWDSDHCFGNVSDFNAGGRQQFSKNLAGNEFRCERGVSNLPAVAGVSDKPLGILNDAIRMSDRVAEGLRSDNNLIAVHKYGGWCCQLTFLIGNRDRLSVFVEPCDTRIGSSEVDSNRVGFFVVHVFSLGRIASLRLLMLTMRPDNNYENSPCVSVLNRVSTGFCCLLHLRETAGFVTGMKMLRESFLIWLVLTVVCGSVYAAHDSDDAARERESKQWTGRRLTKALEIRQEVNVQEIQLREVLLRLQEQSGICIVVDRRIDPSQRLTLSTGRLSTDEVLRRLAAEIPNAGFSVNRAFVYIGPVATSQRLRTLCESQRSMIFDHRRQFDREIYRKLSGVRSLVWDELTSPRDIFFSLAADADLTVVNPDAVPYDLWHAGRVPAMPFAESATMLLCQFDLTFVIDAASAELTIVPMPEVVLLERRHRVLRRHRAAAERYLAENLPELDVKWERSGVRVRATWEEHKAIRTWLSDSEQGSSKR